MPRNGNIALAVRENIALYMSARPKLRLRDIAKTCDLSYSGLSKLMAAKSTVTALSTDTIDKLASGLNIPAAWLVISSGTEMANMSFTGAKVIDEFLIQWAKNLFLGDVGYEKMKHYYADDYYTTGFDSTKMRDLGYELLSVATVKKDGYEIFGLSAKDEYAINKMTNVQRFVINAAKIISPYKVVVAHEIMSIEGHNRSTGSGAACIEFESKFKSMISNVPAEEIKIKSNSVIPGTLGCSTIIWGSEKCYGQNTE
jgi:transcriptional regulator with XRE-family HTH domain